MNVQRYDPDCEYIGAGDYAAYMMSCPNGDFVEYDDYATLQAERDRLKQSNADSQHDMDRLIAERDALRDALVSAENQLHYVEGTYFDACQKARSIIRTALKDTTK